MRKLSLICLLAAPALAQVNIQIPVPTISFTAPPVLVQVAPGVQVVPDSDDEVYFVDNYYWHHRGPNWFRTPRYDGAWVAVEPRFVPRPIFAVPEGRYRHWRHEEHARAVEERKDEHHQEKARHQEEKQEKHHGHH